MKHSTLMHSTMLSIASSLLLFTAVGCAHPYYPPPPPPPPVAQGSPLVQLAEQNGFNTGRSEGAHDAEIGAPYRAHRTRAFHDTPGYNPQLGPFPVYCDAFRDAYLRGYNRGYNRR